MKILFVFVLGLALGALGYYVYQQRQNPGYDAKAAGTHVATSARDAADRAVAKTREVASDISDTLSEKMKSWHLTPSDIHTDLVKTGQVVRQNAARAGEKVSDVRIAAVIKAKFVLDRDLHANQISVDSEGGEVTLTGTVTSETLVGKAVAHALDTDGVHRVVSRLTVSPP